MDPTTGKPIPVAQFVEKRQAEIAGGAEILNSAIHTNKGYKCSVCNRSFTSLSMLVHHNEKVSWLQSFLFSTLRSNCHLIHYKLIYKPSSMLPNHRLVKLRWVNTTQWPVTILLCQSPSFCHLVNHLPPQGAPPKENSLVYAMSPPLCYLLWARLSLSSYTQKEDSSRVRGSCQSSTTTRFEHREQNWS